MTRYSKLQNRRIDPDSAIRSFTANEAYAALRVGEDTRYALGAMQSIDPEYTSNTFKECSRVQNQLERSFAPSGIDIQFDHQGSVTNDTHIKAKSDIDLLCVVQRFHWVELPHKPQFPYLGDPVADLRAARNLSISTLRDRFPEANVIPGGKAIRIEGGSLRRDVDVVTCAWWHTAEYIQSNGVRQWLGIGVLDDDAGNEVKNKPFLHNERIEERDVLTGGKTRKTIRLLKSLKYDSVLDVTLSSYDIVGMVYNMYTYLLDSVPQGSDLLLLERCDTWLNCLEYLPDLRNQIEVPNGTRKVFGEGGATLTGLRQLRRELTDLISAVQRELAFAQKKLEEVRVPSFFPERPALSTPNQWIIR